MQECPEIAIQPETPQIGTELDPEKILSKEIEQLWSVHSQTQTALGRTKEELRALRMELGRRLYDMKLRLASPGRGGQWRKFLSAQRIPRASADRWAKTYERTLEPTGQIASCESIQQSPGETARKVLQSMWPKLREVLTDQETAYQFLYALVQRFDILQAEITDSGIAIQKPTTINSEPSSGVLDTKNVVEGQGAGCECE